MVEANDFVVRAAPFLYSIAVRKHVVMMQLLRFVVDHAVFRNEREGSGIV
jgi:hypothetical protein